MGRFQEDPGEFRVVLHYQDHRVLVVDLPPDPLSGVTQQGYWRVGFRIGSLPSNTPAVHPLPYLG